MLAATLIALALAQPASPAAPTAQPAATTPAAQPAKAKGPVLDEKHAALLSQIAGKASVYLREKQDKATGAWGVKDGAVAFPAITALALAGLLDEPGLAKDDAAVAGAIAFLLKSQKEDGAIFTGALPSYNTSIAAATLAKVNDPKAKDAVAKAAQYLKSIQCGSGTTLPAGTVDAPPQVDKSHPFYGGWGYGRHGRPDLSNTQWALDALHAAGVPKDDPAFQRAIVFLQRCQMADAVNDQSYADGSKQGGFIYSTSESKDKVGSGQTNGGMIEETMDDGKKVSRLRCYGSMTYAGFKSYLYAGLAPDDDRVKLARAWMCENYGLDENPGAGKNGLYYYYVTMARALAASGDSTLSLKGSNPREVNWAHDMIDKLATLQQADGSFKPLDERWMESDPVLITAYSLIALRSMTPTPAANPAPTAPAKH